MVFLAFLPHEIDNFNPTSALKLLSIIGKISKICIMILLNSINKDNIDVFKSHFEAYKPTYIEINLILSQPDPLYIRSRIALKMLMNAHSTAVMTKLGRVVGNTMTNVRAANLKLIGRATYLAKLHIDDVIKRRGMIDTQVPYITVNALLMDTIEYLNGKDRGSESPVPLTIVRTCEGIRIKGNC